VGHFHYTLLAGSTFGFFAGFYYWFPKATGRMLGDGFGKLHFWLMVIGTNVTFLPFFWMGVIGMPRRVVTYTGSRLATLNLISSIGAGILALSLLVFLLNLLRSLLLGAPSGDDPWGGTTLEWLSSSPPPRFNFGNGRFLPRVRSFHPVLDLRLAQQPRDG
jgi:cytochrome c oxidase subunit 1